MKKRFAIFIIMIIAAIVGAHGQKPEAGIQDTVIVHLTPGERAWLDAHPTIRIHAPDGFPPDLFWKDGRFQGILHDYVELISRRTGIRFEYVNIPNDQADEKIKTREIDVRYTFEIPERREEIFFTDPFVNVGWVIVSRSETPIFGYLSRLNGHTIAVVRGMRIYQRMLKDYPDIKWHMVSSPPEAIETVASGKADACINTVASTAYFMRQEVIPYLRIDLLTEYPAEPLMFGVRKDWPELVGIMNKGIATITQDDRNAIFDKWMPLQIKQGPDWTVIWKWAGGIGGIVLLIFSITLYRTPMNAIINMNRLLLDTNLDEEQKDYAEIATMSSDFLLTLINDILDFSKIEAGKMEIENTVFNLKGLVESVVKLIKPKTEEKCLRLEHIIEPAVPLYVTGDPVRVRQILINYMNNAVKFTEKGGITLRVSSENETNTHSTVKFEVADTGIGIPEDRASRLFRPFSQADASTTRKYGGTGLGLVICEQLAILMGGKVGFESREGEGSVFRFTVTMRKAEGVPQTVEPAVRHPVSGIRRSLRILLAEDNFFNQKVTQAILSKSGFSADIVCNGKEAVEALRGKNYDLVLMDVQMPEMDGLEAARTIRNPDSDVLNPTVPIIAMTANATPEDRENCIGAGMNDYLSKPVDADELLSVIGKMADSAGTPVAGEQPDTDHKHPITHIFNRVDFMKRFEGHGDLCYTLLRLFLEQVADQMEKLHTAIDEKDAPNIRLHAHSIKGMCANISAERFRDAAYQIELAGKENRLDLAASLIDRLEEEFGALKSVLSDVISSPP